MKTKLTLVALILCQTVIAQVSTTSGYWLSKEYSKEISLYKAKAFVMKDVFQASSDIIQFEIDPLAATNSGEVTSLVYRCEVQNKEGLILGFYGNYWNDAGVVYQGYSFKNLPKEDAVELLNKITDTMEEQYDFLSADSDNDNVYFQYDDILVLIYKSAEIKIRLFWNDFDAEWGKTAFKRTKKRFEKNLN